jgi:alkylation response protein AidB-like acyl-CoA dehydrogenase
VTVNEAGLPHLALVPKETAGLTIINDWSSFGQRTTASGTVVIDKVQYLLNILFQFSKHLLILQWQDLFHKLFKLL